MIATCPERETLRDYANGMLPENQSDELTAHLRDCPSCQSWLSETEHLEDTLVGQLRNCSTVDDSFEKEPQCQSAMARALGALASAGEATQEDLIDLPSSIGDYEIVRSIGRGGMGNVYLAQHAKLDRKVAVKVLASHRLSDPRMHDRFEKEMRAIGSLSHANIVTAHDARDVDGVALLVTEWIDGLDLKDILGRVGPLSVADASEVGARIANALSYISRQELVHRDLKPSNVMINREGEVKLLDLGLARLRSGDGELDATATGQALGTADYVAPEQINDARDVDIRADVYGLGCTLYKLLSGRAPFEGDRYRTTFAKLTAHVSEQPASLADVAPRVPTAITNLVDQMLAKSPQERPSSLDVIEATLKKHSTGANLASLVRTALATQPTATPAGETHMVRPSTKRIWRRRVPITVAIASGLVGLLLGWCAGVLITITHPDGTKTTIDAPAGSHVGVEFNADETADAAQGPAPQSPILDVLQDLAPPDDAAKFAGVWRLTSATYTGGGLALSGENHALVFHGNDVVIMQRSRPVMAGTWSIDSDLTQLTFKFLPADAEQTHKAVYRFQSSGELRLCIGGKADFPRVLGDRGTTDMWLNKIATPTTPAQAAALLQNPATKDLLHSIAMYERLKSGVPMADLIKASQTANAAVNETVSRNNLKKIGIAFHIYHDTFRVFPASRGGPYAGKPKNDDPPCSWRVAILPFIEQNELFEQYHFDEPWDSKHNLTLLEKMPAVFRRPDSPDSMFTGYVGFSGENTVLGVEGEPTRIRDITDGTSNTLMLVEAETEIPWTKPEDISISEIASSGLLENDRLLVSMTDGSIEPFKPVTEQAIREAATINDAKYINDGK